MRNKGVVVVLTIVITALCLYYLSFTFVSRKIQQKAIAQATDKDGSVNLAKKQNYLDSLWNKPVYNIFGAEYTYKEVKESELSLGLDLQGGMHVVLEISPIDIIKTGLREWKLIFNPNGTSSPTACSSPTSRC